MRPVPRIQIVKPAVLVADESLKIRFANRALCEKLDLQSEELVGRSLAEFFASENKEHTALDILSKLELGQKFEIEIPLFTGSNQEKLLKFDVFPVEAIDGKRSVYMALGSTSLKRRKHLNLPDAGEPYQVSYKSSSLSYQRGKNLYERVESLVVGQRLFQDSTLTVASLARRLQTNTQYLSQVINFFSGNSFSTYVNLLRLEEIRNLHLNGQASESDLADWQEAGFGSYSAYYRTLKRHCGVSPASFVKALHDKRENTPTPAVK